MVAVLCREEGKGSWFKALSNHGCSSKCTLADRDADRPNNRFTRKNRYIPQSFPLVHLEISTERLAINVLPKNSSYSFGLRETTLFDV
jgi:hypothetical protein